MSSFIPKWKEKKLHEIKSHVHKLGKPMVGIAFPGRASILTNLLGLSQNELSATYEIEGSIKTGNFIPGSRIPILPEKELFDLEERPSVVLNLAWHIEEDVRKNFAYNNYYPEILNII